LILSKQKTYEVFGVLGATFVVYLWFQVVGELALKYVFEAPKAVISLDKIVYAIGGSVLYCFAMKKLKNISEGEKNV